MATERANDGTSVTLKLVGARLAFPSVFKKDKYGRYSATLIVAPKDENYNKIVAAIKQVAKAKWGDKAEATLKTLFAKDDVCLHDGNNKPDLAGYPGNYYLSCTNQNRPTLLNRAREDIDESSGLLYSGCYPVALVEIWAQDNPAKGWKRINCQLQGLQHYKDGERFAGGRIANKDEFDDLSNLDDEGDDLVGGSGDDSPF